MSTNDFISVFLSIELQSYGCAPGEVFTEEISSSITSSLLSGIIGPLQKRGYLPRMTTVGRANNSPIWIAGHNKVGRMGLPPLEVGFSGDSYGQDNEFDTYREAQLGPYAQSSISRHMEGNLNVCTSSPYSINCQKPFAHFSIEDKRAQSPKTITTNVSNIQPRDLTAYEYNCYLMRGRSFHSSTEYNIKSTKGSSRKPLLLDTPDSNAKGAESLNPAKDSLPKTSVSS